jgi:hypothetical protein
VERGTSFSSIDFIVKSRTLVSAMGSAGAEVLPPNRDDRFRIESSMAVDTIVFTVRFPLVLR